MNAVNCIIGTIGSAMAYSVAIVCYALTLVVYALFCCFVGVVLTPFVVVYLAGTAVCTVYGCARRAFGRTRG